MVEAGPGGLEDRSPPVETRGKVLQKLKQRVKFYVQFLTFSRRKFRNLRA